jgi:DNA phosphorothioation-dependent restriction protein DptG
MGLADNTSGITCLNKPIRFCARFLMGLAVCMLLLGSRTWGYAGQRQKDVLTERQTEDLREADDQPVEKLKLYLGYIDERTQELEKLNTNFRAQNRDAEIHNLFQEFTQLADELQDNMDSFDEQHEDLRKGLKLILEKSERWPDVLNAPKPNPEYDFVRKTALEAAKSVHEDAQKLLDEQNDYFAKQKKEKGKTGGP